MKRKFKFESDATFEELKPLVDFYHFALTNKGVIQDSNGTFKIVMSVGEIYKEILKTYAYNKFIKNDPDADIMASLNIRALAFAYVLKCRFFEEIELKELSGLTYLKEQIRKIFGELFFYPLIGYARSYTESLNDNDPKKVYLFNTIKSFIVSISAEKGFTFPKFDVNDLMDKTKFKRYYTETYYQYRLDFITSMIGSFKEYIKPLFVSDDTDQILLDFLNYMIRICDYDDTYSRFDLALEAKEELRAEELEKLKDFLLSTEKYGIGLSKGKTLSDLYSKIERSRAKHSKKLSELEALAYAYAKSTECPVESIPESGINDIDNLVVYMKSH